MNQLGQRVVIRGNDVSGVGLRDDDTIPNPNAPEILLTESYGLYYEGKPASVSRGGFVLQIPMVMHGAVRPGSLVSILSGEHAGRWFAMAQPLTSTAFLMADALPAGDYAIAVAHGFVDCVFEQNRIDVRGGKSAVVVLAGNHFQRSVSPAVMTNPAPALIRIGGHSGEDTGQMKLDLAGNGYRSAQPGEASLTIRHAIINGQPVSERTNRLPVVP